MRQSDQVDKYEIGHGMTEIMTSEIPFRTLLYHVHEVEEVLKQEEVIISDKIQKTGRNLYNLS